jgi:hypothetical protein
MGEGKGENREGGREMRGLGRIEIREGRGRGRVCWIEE